MHYIKEKKVKNTIELNSRYSVDDLATMCVLTPKIMERRLSRIEVKKKQLAGLSVRTIDRLVGNCTPRMHDLRKSLLQLKRDISDPKPRDFK